MKTIDSLTNGGGIFGDAGGTITLHPTTLHPMTPPPGSGGFGGDTPAGAAPKVVRLSERVRRPTEWLLPGRIALGRLTVLVGEPGLGAGAVVADWAARVSRGIDPSFGETRPHVGVSLRDTRVEDGGLGVGQDGELLSGADPSFGETRPRGGVIYIAAEDEREDVLPARLVAAEADLDRICTIEPELAAGEFADPLPMQEQLEALEAAIREATDCKLVVIDPLAAMLAGEEKWNAATLQRLTRALANMARRQRVAIVATADLNLRASLQSVDRMTRVFRAGCSGTRVLGMFRDPDAAGQCLIVPLEVNFAAEQKALSFRLVAPSPIGSGQGEGAARAVQGIKHPHPGPLPEGEGDIVALGGEVVTSLEKLLTRGRFNGIEQAYRDKQDFVTTRLREILSDGPRDRSDLAFVGLGSQDQIYRGAKRLGVVKEKTGFRDGWIWMLPEHHAKWKAKQAARAAKQRERKSEKQRERRAEERTAQRAERNVVDEDDFLQEVAERAEAQRVQAAHEVARPVVGVVAAAAETGTTAAPRGTGMSSPFDNGAPKGSGVGVDGGSVLQNTSTPTPTRDPACSTSVDVSPREAKCLSRSERPTTTPAPRGDQSWWHTREFIVGGKKLTVETPADMDEAEREAATQKLLKQEADFQRDAEQAEARMREAGEWEEEWEVDSS